MANLETYYSLCNIIIIVFVHTLRTYDSCCQQRQYNHTAWRQTKHQSGWIVQYQGRTIGGFHSSQDEVAGTLIKALGRKRKQELRIIGTPKASKQRSAFNGVSYHNGNNKLRHEHWIDVDHKLGGNSCSRKDTEVGEASAEEGERPKSS